MHSNSYGRRTLALAITLALSSVASASTLFAIRADKNELWKIDTQTFQATMIGPYKTGNPSEPVIPLIALDAGGNLFGLSAGGFSGSLFQFDTNTGGVTELHKLMAPTGPLGLDIDPVGGDLFWINTGGFNPAPQIQAIDTTTFAFSFYGNIGTFSQWFGGMAFDPNGQMYALETNSNSLWHIDVSAPTGPGTFQIGTLGAQVDVTQGGSLTFDGESQQFIGYAAATHNLFTVDTGTGVATVLHNFTGAVPPLLGIAGDRCQGTSVPYGIGCAGTGGFVPEFSSTGCPSPGGTVTFDLKKGLGGSVAVIVFGLIPAQIPIGGGCDLLVQPLLTPTVAVPLTAGGPGQGEYSFSVILPPILAGNPFTMQNFVIDSGSPVGGAGSNALQVIVN